LDYGANVAAFPSEYSWIQLDQRSGPDYLVVLYAKEALDLGAIRSRFAREVRFLSGLPRQLERIIYRRIKPVMNRRLEVQRTGAGDRSQVSLGGLKARRHCKNTRGEKAEGGAKQGSATRLTARYETSSFAGDYQARLWTAVILIG
jgi:hypothetical protein